MKFHSAVVNTIASSVMTIYLIHDNGCIKTHIWFDLLCVQDHLSDIALYMFVCVIVITCICFLIDFVLKHTLLRWVMRILNRPVEYITYRLSSMDVPY